MVPHWNGVVCPKVAPVQGLKQGCCLSPVLCVAFMNAFTCKAPVGASDLAKEAFSHGTQNSKLVLTSIALAERVSSLQFVDDTTLLTTTKEGMQKLFEKYYDFCSKYRVTVNWSKCPITSSDSRRSLCAAHSKTMTHICQGALPR